MTHTGCEVQHARHIPRARSSTTTCLPGRRDPRQPPPIWLPRPCPHDLDDFPQHRQPRFPPWSRPTRSCRHPPAHRGGRRHNGTSGEGRVLTSPTCATPRRSIAPWASTIRRVHPVSTGLVVSRWPGLSGGGDRRHGGDPVTFSFVGRCGRDGDVSGIAVRPPLPPSPLAAPIPAAGVGAVASQNVTDPTLGPLALTAMAAGLSAADAWRRLSRGGRSSTTAGFAHRREGRTGDPFGFPIRWASGPHGGGRRRCCLLGTLLAKLTLCLGHPLAAGSDCRDGASGATSSSAALARRSRRRAERRSVHSGRHADV